MSKYCQVEEISEKYKLGDKMKQSQKRGNLAEISERTKLNIKVIFVYCKN